MTLLPFTLALAACLTPGAPAPWLPPQAPSLGGGTTPVEAPVLKNLVYGMASGAALTMDIYKPKKPNKLGIIIIPGTAYGYAFSNDYNQPSAADIFAQEAEYFGKYAKELIYKGYTLFVINHRLSPRFHAEDVLGDCQRAVRYIRFNASRFGIDAQHLGAFGYSSGATLCAMLGVNDPSGAASRTGMDAVSSKVQAVVTLAARFDLADFNKPEDSTLQNPIVSRVLSNYLGELPPVENGTFVMKGKYAEASPLHHVDRNDAPFLIYTSQDDPLVPPRQAERMRDRLLKEGIRVQLRLSDHEGHAPIPDVREIDQWFLNNLKN